MTLVLHLAVALLQTAAPKDDFAQLWEKCSKAIQNGYYARQTRKGEMEGLLNRYAPIAKGAKSRQEFSRTMDQLIAEFHDSHFDFLPDDEQGFYTMDGLGRKEGAEMPHIGAWFRRVKDGYAVRMVLDGMPAQRADLRKGDLILSVDGQPFSPVASLRDKVGRSVTLHIRRDKKEFDAKVEVQKEPSLKMFLEATRNSAHVIDTGKFKIGYIHLWTQANDDFRQALQGAVYGKLRDTDGFILDLRDGFGGRPEGFMDPFFRPEVRIEWKMGGATGPGMKQLFGYGRPLVVLINEGSRSAKEVLSYIIKRSGRAKLVGNTTAGDVLGTSPFKVADWAYLEIPMVDVIVDGYRIERKGVDPDVKIVPEIDGQGHDRQLEGALKILTPQIAKKPPLEKPSSERIRAKASS